MLKTTFYVSNVFELVRVAEKLPKTRVFGYYSLLDNAPNFLVGCIIQKRENIMKKWFEGKPKQDYFFNFCHILMIF